MLERGETDRWTDGQTGTQAGRHRETLFPREENEAQQIFKFFVCPHKGRQSTETAIQSHMVLLQSVLHLILS